LVIEKVIAIRVFRLSGEVVGLVDTIQRSFDYAFIGAFLDLLLQLVALGTTGDINERRHPVQRREYLFKNGARLDDARPPDNARSAHAAFPSGQLAGFERGDAAIRE